MDPGNLLTLPAVSWKVESLVEVGPSRLLLDLYDREQTPLKRYLAMLGLDAETARDVVQEGFLKLHEHLLAGGDRTNLRAWLYRVVHNTARNTQTSAAAKRTGSIEDLQSAEPPAASQLSAEDVLLDQERGQRLRLAMSKLSEAQRSCLVLRSQGLKYREIAEALALSVSTVGENVQRGLERLKELL